MSFWSLFEASLFFSSYPRITQTSYPASSAFASQDVVFSAALKRLPVLLKEAIMEAGLDDPTLLQSYPLVSLLELGLFESTTLSMGSTYWVLRYLLSL